MRRVLAWLVAVPLIGMSAFALCLAGLAWRQPDAVTLPAPTGPYAVGRVSLDWRDDTRADPFAVAPGTPRELPVWIWYPASRANSAPRVDYMPPALRAAMQPDPPLLLRLTLGPLTTDRANVTTHALDAPPMVAGGPAPVLVLKPALGAAAVQNSVLAEDLASHGYVVVGSDSPHTTPGVAYQDGRIVKRTPAGHPPENAPGRTSELAPGQPNDNYVKVVAEWASDNRFIVDRLQALNAQDSAGRFTGRLDLESVGAFGHSLGGAAALQFCHEDRRCKAGVDLDGMPYGEAVRDGMAKPFLFLFADRPLFERPDAELDQPGRDFLAAIARMRQRSPARPSLLRLRDAGHFNLFDQALLTQPAIWRLFGQMGPADPTRLLDVTRRYVRAFFDTHLRARRDPLLAGASPEFPEMVFP